LESLQKKILQVRPIIIIFVLPWLHLLEINWKAIKTARVAE